MNRDLLKRVGMLTAATAACTAGVFGALAVNGLRYMRPTTDNWWLLPWVEPAERIEQCVMDFGEGDPTYTVTGYDAQNREIWSRTTFGKLASVGSSRDVYIGNTSARYFFGQGGKADSVCQYDEQGRLIRMETDYGGISTYYYRGDATETYLEETHNAQDHRNRPANRQYRHQYGHIRGRWYLSCLAVLHTGFAWQHRKASACQRGRTDENL